MFLASVIIKIGKVIYQVKALSVVIQMKSKKFRNVAAVLKKTGLKFLRASKPYNSFLFAFNLGREDQMLWAR